MVQARGLPLDGPMSSIIRAIRREHALTDAECAALEKNRLFVHGPWYIWACEMSPREQGAVALDDHVVDACLIVLLLKCVHDTPGGFCALLRDDRNKVLYGPMIETMLSCAHATDAERPGSGAITRNSTYARCPGTSSWPCSNGTGCADA